MQLSFSRRISLLVTNGFSEPDGVRRLFQLGFGFPDFHFLRPGGQLEAVCHDALLVLFYQSRLFWDIVIFPLLFPPLLRCPPHFCNQPSLHVPGFLPSILPPVCLGEPHSPGERMRGGGGRKNGAVPYMWWYYRSFSRTGPLPESKNWIVEERNRKN